jgi:hypothetical protein
MAHKFIAGRGADLLTESQRHTLVLFERIGGSISLVAVLMIFVAYALVPRVRNVQNTFIVFASVANIGACCASIIAMDGLELGVSSPLCQAQSFMFHMLVAIPLLLSLSPSLTYSGSCNLTLGGRWPWPSTSSSSSSSAPSPTHSADGGGCTVSSATVALLLLPLRCFWLETRTAGLFLVKPL